ncbi:MAG: hypothetical protein IH600_08670 [Bacteroidetes bacterium]|nr:hypothetical protein [Bacteroidota bacterium]
MKTLTTILLSLLMLQTAGPLFLLQLQQTQIRREMKRAIRAGLPDEDLVAFVVQADGNLAGGEALEWEDAHEFRYRGVMYDVARSRAVEGGTLYLCVRDDAETAVYAQLDDLARKDGSGNPLHRRQAEQLLRHLLLTFVQQEAVSPDPALAETAILPEIVAATISRPATPPDPPPNV